MGSIDVLVNNATCNCWCSFEECKEDIMRNVFYTNYILPQYMIKAALPYMRQSHKALLSIWFQLQRFNQEREYQLIQQLKQG